MKFIEEIELEYLQKTEQHFESEETQYKADYRARMPIYDFPYGFAEYKGTADAEVYCDR